MRPRVPFATSGWLTHWWQHYREDRLLVRDRFFVHTVRDENGALIAIAPLMLTDRPATGPLRSRCITFLGVDKNVTELRGLICQPEREGAAVRALLAHFSARRDEWDWFAWDGILRDGEGYRVLTETEGFEWRGETTDYVLSLPDTWEKLRASRSRNIKESLRKCYNSLKRGNHHFTFRVVSDAAELPAALERFFVLHSRRANSNHLLDHADYFTPSPARRLLFDLAAKPNQAPSLRAFELSIAGSVVASRLGFLLGDELYLYFSGFAPEWGRYSVMTTTVAEAIKWAIERKVRLVNLSPGTDISKTRWGPSAITTCDGVLCSPTLRGRLTRHAMDELNDRSGRGTWLAHIVDLGRRRR